MMTGARFLEIRNAHERGILKPGDVKELLSEVARLRVALALNEKELEKARAKVKPESTY